MEQPGIDSAPNPAPGATAWLDADGRVAGDVACLHCGYNLRTLRAEGSCPECGAAVKTSVEAARLLFADRVWLQGIIRGLELVVLGVVLLPVEAIAAFALTHRIIGGHHGFSIVMIITPREALAVALVGMVVAALTISIIAWGIWKLTAPEPGTGGLERWKTRLTIRVAGLTSGILFLLAVPIIVVGWEATAQVASFLLCLVATIFGIAALLYGLWLARRMGSKTLTRWTIVLTVSYAILAMGLGIGLTLALFSSNLVAWVFVLEVLIGGPTLLGTFYLAMGYRALLDRLVYAALARAAAQSAPSAQRSEKVCSAPQSTRSPPP